MKIIRRVATLFLIIFVALSLTDIVFANEEQRAKELEQKIQEYEQQIKGLQAKASTLSNQIAQFNAQIRLTELKISQTEEQILLLTGRIHELDKSLTDLTSAFTTRVIETYKLSRLGDFSLLAVAAPYVEEALSRYHYLKRIQEADRNLMSRLQKAHTTYTGQKDELTRLQDVLGVQKENLDGQKAAKSQLLTVTQSDEKKYQALLASARAEFEAIQAILAGRGDETEAGHISEGQKIASIIQGPSCNSSGKHLHFIVAKSKNIENPFDHLRGGVNYQNCSGPGECSSADSFDPKGSWRWPILEPIRFTQGFGKTWAVNNTYVGKIYQFHNGIDIDSTSPEIVAVKSGTLYRGSYTGVAGCRLRYVRVDHDDSDIETYYLHINY